MASIKSISAGRILNSRGDWTVEVDLILDKGILVRASVPEGRSKGSREAVYLPVESAIRSVEKYIAPALKGADPADQEKIDKMLIKLDGTRNKSRLGANAVLAVSIACARAAAQARGVPLWQHIKQLMGGAVPRYPLRIFANIINGGLPRGNALDVQGNMIIPKTKSIPEAVNIITEIYRRLGSVCNEKYGASGSLVGEEGGYAPAFDNNLSPLSLIQEAAKGFKVEVGIDSAASNIKLAPHQLLDMYRTMKDEFNITYIEDPFSENLFSRFADLTKGFGKNTIIAGDDLTVTNVERMKQAHNKKSINGIIIKPNQVGTVTESLAAVKLARQFGWQVIASHRSGETNDDFIADFAVGVNADGIKIGAPARGERIAKYNRLLEINN